MALMANMEVRGEWVLREWGAHWKARLSGHPRENLSKEINARKDAGDTLKEIEALKQLYPHMSYEDALDAQKYAPLPRRPQVSPPVPGMAQIERDVSHACKTIGEMIWDRFCLDELGISDPGDIPSTHWQGRQQAILGVRFLVREVYVIGTPVRSPKYPKSSFDWCYPYAARAKDRTDDGKLTTLRLVRAEL